MSEMARRVASLLAAAILVAALGAGGPGFALGDGDPASDVLLGQNVYYPYSPPVPRSVQATLNAETAAAMAASDDALTGLPAFLGIRTVEMGPARMVAELVR